MPLFLQAKLLEAALPLWQRVTQFSRCLCQIISTKVFLSECAHEVFAAHFLHTLADTRFHRRWTHVVTGLSLGFLPFNFPTRAKARVLPHCRPWQQKEKHAGSRELPGSWVQLLSGEKRPKLPLRAPSAYVWHPLALICAPGVSPGRPDTAPNSLVKTSITSSEFMYFNFTSTLSLGLMGKRAENWK